MIGRRSLRLRAVEKVALLILYLGSILDMVIKAMELLLSRSCGNTSTMWGSATFGKTKSLVSFEVCSLMRSLHLFREDSKMKYVSTTPQIRAKSGRYLLKICIVLDSEVAKLSKRLVMVAGSGTRGLLKPSQTTSLEYWRQRFMVRIN